MTIGSDLDLFVVRPSGVDPDDELWSRQLAELSDDVSLWTGNDTRILEYGEEAVSSSRGRAEPVLPSIVAEGLTLHGPADWLRSRLTKGRKRAAR